MIVYDCVYIVYTWCFRCEVLSEDIAGEPVQEIAVIQVRWCEHRIMWYRYGVVNTELCDTGALSTNLSTYFRDSDQYSCILPYRFIDNLIMIIKQYKSDYCLEYILLFKRITVAIVVVVVVVVVFYCTKRPSVGRYTVYIYLFAHAHARTHTRTHMRIHTHTHGMTTYTRVQHNNIYLRLANMVWCRPNTGHNVLLGQIHLAMI
jgi:hypothetical protein